MPIVTLYFIRSNEPDEVLKISRIAPHLYKCVFCPADLPSRYSFTANRCVLMHYLRTTLNMVVQDDVDPYEQVQISTVIHPRILFGVTDLLDEAVFARLWETLQVALHTTIEKNEMSSEEEEGQYDADSEWLPRPERIVRRTFAENTHG